jgi:GNAT superfamily N-acetyltransferase
MIKIRKARLKDTDEILDLWKDFMSEHDNVVIKRNSMLKPYTIKKSDAKNNFRSFIKRNIRSRNGIVFVAEDGKEIIGYLLCTIKKNIPIFKLERIGYMNDLYVKKKYRGTKISTGFKNKAMQWFREKGMKHASIMVSPENKKAHGIYKNWGFHDYHIELRKKI